MVVEQPDTAGGTGAASEELTRRNPQPRDLDAEQPEWDPLRNRRLSKLRRVMERQPALAGEEDEGEEDEGEEEGDIIRRFDARGDDGAGEKGEPVEDVDRPRDVRGESDGESDGESEESEESAAGDGEAGFFPSWVFPPDDSSTAVASALLVGRLKPKARATRSCDCAPELSSAPYSPALALANAAEACMSISVSKSGGSFRRPATELAGRKSAVVCRTNASATLMRTCGGCGERQGNSTQVQLASKSRQVDACRCSLIEGQMIAAGASRG